MIAAILLAAGQSRRMGTQKLLLPFAGQIVIGHVADRFLRSRCDRVVAVVSPDSPLRAALEEKNVTLVENPDVNGDMLSSVRAGIRALPPECDAALIAPGDMPLIATAVIDSLIESFAAHSKITVPIHGGKRGHPLLVPRRYFAKVLNSYDGVGLRGLLQIHSNEVREMKVDCSGILHDVDLPEDYEEALKQLTSVVNEDSH
jgi:molybdenum cofactor cytidylyltransferase